MSRKTILVIGFATLLLIVGGVLLIASTHKDTSSLNTTNKVVSRNGVTITNFNLGASGVSTDQYTNLQSTLYDRLSTKGAYTATVRGEHYTRTMVNGYTNVDFLIDIPAAKQTYHVSVTIAGPDSYRAIEVLCPSKLEMIYANQTCAGQGNG